MTLKSQLKTAFFTFPASAKPRRRKRRENSIGSNASSAPLSVRSPYPKMRTQPRSWLSFMRACCRFTCQNAPCRSQKQSKSKCSNALTLTASVRRFRALAHQCKAAKLVACSFEPRKKDLMISKIISRAACLRELASNPKSFSNCPDLHGGVPELAQRLNLYEARFGKKTGRPAGNCSAYALK